MSTRKAAMTPPPAERRPYVPPADDEPLDAVEEALVEAFVSIFVKKIRAELAAAEQRAPEVEMTATAQHDDAPPARESAGRYDALPDLCTPEEARAFLRCGRTTLYELVKSGALRSIKFGKTIRIPKAALLKGTEE